MSKRVRVHYFAICESPERHATVWRLWTPDSKGDVYLGARFVAHNLKLSVHESGLRLLREKAAPGSSGEQKRAVLRWSGPPRHAPGFEVVWQIITPFGTCREAKLDESYKTRVEWLPQERAQFTATEFEFVLSFGLIFREGEYPRAEVPGTQCVLRWQLANGETLFLLRRTLLLPHELSIAWGMRLIDATRELSMRAPQDWRLNRRNYSHRMHVIESLSEHHRCVDLALDV